MSKKAFNAFISYSRKDGVEFVNRLRQRLAEDADGKQVKLWKDREQMEGDKDWWEQIKEALEQSEYLILVVTPKALESGVCQKEWRYAREQGVCVRPVKGVADSEIKYELLPAGMRDAHIYDIDEEWRKFVNDLNETCKTNRLIFLAPPLPRDYVERKDIFDFVKKQLLENKNDKSVALSSALKGAGGFGKTVMAAAICHDKEIQERYHGGILWATIGEDGNLQREVTKIYRALIGDDTRVFIDDDEASRSLSEKLEQGKYLVVLDDVWKYGDVSVLAEKINNIKDTALLITTRIDTVVQKSGSTECEVNEMSEEQAMTFFTAGWDIQTEHKSLVIDILAAMGGWLILLKLVKSAAEITLKTGDSLLQTLSDLKEIYITEGLTAFDVRDSKLRNEAVERCIEASFRFLKVEEKDKCLMLGIFPTDVEIPLEVISSLWQLNSLPGKQLLQRLNDYSLLDLDLGKKVVTFHDVFLHYYNEKLGKERGNVHKKLIKAWPDVYKLSNAYAWQFYIWHLNEAGEKDSAVKLLQSFGWIEAKLFATDINELLKDYEQFEKLDADTNLIYRALKLSAHVLTENKNQIAAQLIGRLTGTTNIVFQQLVNGAKQWKKEDVVRLRPKTRSLIPPGNLIMILKGHENIITQLIVQKGKIISGSWDKTIRIWDMDTGRQIGEPLKGHEDRITQLIINEGKIISGSDDKTIRIWDVDTGAKIGEPLKGHEYPITQLTVDEGKIISGSDDKTIRIWDVDTGVQIGEPMKGHESRIKQLIVHKGKIISGSLDKTIRIWNIDTGTQIGEPLKGHEYAISQLTVDDGKIISGSWDKTIRIWDMDTRRQIGEPLKGHEGTITQLIVNEGKIISGSDDKTIRIWDVDTGAQIGEPLKGHEYSITQLTVDDGKIISGSWDKTIRIWDVDTGAQIGEPLKGHGSIITQLTVNAGKIISGSDDKTIRIWDMDTGAQIGEPLKGHESAITQLTVDDGKIISGSYDNIRIWDMDTGRQIDEPLKLKGHESWIIQLIVHEGKIISGSDDKTIRIWDLDTGVQIGEPLKGHESAITQLTVDDGKIISGSDDKTIRIWDLDTGAQIGEPLKGHEYAISQLTVDDGKIISGSYDNIRIWDMDTGRQIDEPLKGHEGWITQLIINDGKIISGSDDKTIRIWDVDTGAQIGDPLKGHEYAISQLTVDDGKIISGSWDKTIQIWDMNTGRQIGKPLKGHEDKITQLIVNAGKIISGSRDNTIRIWDMSKHDNHILFEADAEITCMIIQGNQIIVGDAIGKIHFLEPVGFKL